MSSTCVVINISTCIVFDSDPDGSATDSTSSDEEVGGLGKFSHGKYGLVHQHWVWQVICAGAFNVHNTEAPEAHHKICMRLASARVRHLHVSKTKSSMLQYLLLYDLFCGMFKEDETPKRRRLEYSYGVRKFVNVPMERDQLLSAGYQEGMLHPEALVTRHELLDLLCLRLGVPTTRASYRILSTLNWTFGQKVIRSDGLVCWATNSQYPYGTAKQRRDVFRIHGTEVVNGIENAFCCESILFVTISGCEELCFAAAPWYQPDNTEMTFVLGRWMSPHPTSHDRDKQHRPICPGALNINHCLWTYAESDRARSALVDPETYGRQRHMFGRTILEQDARRTSDQNAYFCLLDVDSISHVVHMAPVFVDLSSEHDHRRWLQTVTVI